MNTSSGAKLTKMLPNEIHSSDVTSGRQIQPLGLNAKRVIAKRYSLKDAKGNPIEEWSDIVARVVAHVSVAETDPLLTLANDRFLVAHVLTALSSQDFAPARSWRSTWSTASMTSCG